VWCSIPRPGLTVVEIMHAARKREIADVRHGENPAMSDPDLDHAREALAALDWLVVQDIFLTETAYLADVVLPASAWPEKTGTVTNTDRMVQLGRRALDMPATPARTCGSSRKWRRGSGWTGTYQGPESGVAESVR